MSDLCQISLKCALDNLMNLQIIKCMINWQFFGLELFEFSKNVQKSKIEYPEHNSVKFEKD